MLLVIIFIFYLIWCITVSVKCKNTFDSIFMGLGCFIISLFLTPFAGKWFFKPQNTSWNDLKDAYDL